MPEENRSHDTGSHEAADAKKGKVSRQEDGSRRGFFSEVLAFFIGGAILTVPLVGGLALFLDPLLRRKPASSSGQDARRDADGYLRVASLASLPDNGKPQIFTVYDDVVDAWNKFADQPIGRVFLRKLSDGNVTAFNVRCPHLGCAVDYRSSHNDYFCPCHMSAFNLDGQKENEIPPRGMDSLDVKIKNKTEVWVRYQFFKAGTPEKIPV
ncbi:MAG TPA: Rieske (2Fe-2S) protein [Planctomycetaceae bacterium]|nr:Rieske (2Fe-2S) protein [Planctomycetaceae bacterium]